MEKNRKTAGICLVVLFSLIFLISFVAAHENYGGVHQTSYNRVNHYSNYNTHTTSYTTKNVNTIHYTQYATQSSRKSFFGDYVKTYSVNVKNRGYTGRYFTVVFNFEDKNGYEFSESVTKYLRDDESKSFVYKDIQYERHEIVDWDYEIIARR